MPHHRSHNSNHYNQPLGYANDPSSYYRPRPTRTLRSTLGERIFTLFMALFIVASVLAGFLALLFFIFFLLSP